MPFLGNITNGLNSALKKKKIALVYVFKAWLNYCSSSMFPNYPLLGVAFSSSKILLQVNDITSKLIRKMTTNKEN